MSEGKVSYPGLGCLVEFMQGNNVHLGIITGVQGDKLHIYTQTKRETTLPRNRLLPWGGPLVGANLSRENMDTSLEEHKIQRENISAEINILELWECVQGELEITTAEALMGFLWTKGNVNHEAALGRTLLAGKNYFRFTPPSFDIFPKNIVEQRIAEATAQQLREKIAHTGSELFRTLWAIYNGKKIPVPDLPVEEQETQKRLTAILRTRIADPDTTEDDHLWQLLTKGLPENNLLAVCLALAWGIIEPHHNYFLDRIDYATGATWAEPYAATLSQIKNDVATKAETYPLCMGENGTPPTFLTIDPTSTVDRDDAFAVTHNADGTFILRIAIAAPALFWPFESDLDKLIARRASSLYLPEGNCHMLPKAVGWQIFGLDANSPRLALVATIHFDAAGVPQPVDLAIQRVLINANLRLVEAEQALLFHAHPTQPAVSANIAKADIPDAWLESIEQEEISASLDEEENITPQHPAYPYQKDLQTALLLARRLQEQRIAKGAVITERPMPEVELSGKGASTTVHFLDEPDTPLAFAVVGEFMIAANTGVAKWALARKIPLYFRTQDVGIPKEYAGVWSTPEDIARVVRHLPPTLLDCTPKKHAGLGVETYTSYSAPLRRYVDLFNQGQILSYLENPNTTNHNDTEHNTTNHNDTDHDKAEPVQNQRYSQAQLQEQLPFINSKSNPVVLVQRMRPRYWKLLYFLQQGDKKWWQATVTEENNAFVFVSIPFAQLFFRGKRSLFDDKLTLGQCIEIRLGKINPLFNEIHIVETREI